MRETDASAAASMMLERGQPILVLHYKPPLFNATNATDGLAPLQLHMKIIPLSSPKQHLWLHSRQPAIDTAPLPLILRYFDKEITYFIRTAISLASLRRGKPTLLRRAFSRPRRKHRFHASDIHAIWFRARPLEGRCLSRSFRSTDELAQPRKIRVRHPS